MLLGAERTCDILSTVHLAAALVIEAKHRWRRPCFNGRRTLGLIADSSCFGTGISAESRGKHAGIALSGLPAAAGDGGVYLRREKAVTVTFADNPCRKQKPCRVSSAAAVCSGKRGSNTLRCEHTALLGIPSIQAIRLGHQGRMSSHTRTERRGHFLGDIHPLSAVVV